MTRSLSTEEICALVSRCAQHELCANVFRTQRTFIFPHAEESVRVGFAVQV